MATLRGGSGGAVSPVVGSAAGGMVTTLRSGSVGCIMGVGGGGGGAARDVRMLVSCTSALW